MFHRSRQAFLPFPSAFFIWICVLFSTVGSSSAGEPVDFNRDIRPILSGKCFACHGPDEKERSADLRLDTEKGSRADLGGYAAVDPGKPKESELIFRVTVDDEVDLMPPPDKGKRLTAKEVDLLTRWIEQGARYAVHWSYQKPTRPEVPASQKTENSAPVQNPIDAFIRCDLAKQGLRPAPRAGRLALARRIALDLTGLPPAWEEAATFARDTSENAIEKYVDHQLAKPAFGERWAQVWLDLARYADSAGYADDPPRIIWAYRDWVIRAFNQNMPFDQFSIEQIAGDLLENPTRDQLVATAFHRNTLTNNEGGTNDEEFRNVAVVDRVNTTMEVWMGTTMACAQCHTHKYDPISQNEYFQMFDFFNQSEDTDKKDERPRLDIWAAQQIKQKKTWEEELTKLKRSLNQDTPALQKERGKWLSGLQREPEWAALTLRKATGGKVTQNPEDHWIRLQGDKPKTAAYSLVFPVAGEQSLAGLRLEISPQQKENFVLSRVSATWVPEKSQSLPARFVRVELPGKNKFLHLAEVEIFSGGANIAPQGKVSQISTDYAGPAALAIDGNTDGDYAKKSVSHTARADTPWLEVDLGATRELDSIKIWNRTDNKLEDRLQGYRIKILDEKRTVVWENTPSEVPRPSASFTLSGSRTLAFGAAHASFEQKGFPAQNVLQKKLDKKKGWAIAGKEGTPVFLTLPLAAPVMLKGGFIRVRLDQVSEHQNHLLTHFRLAATTSSGLPEWARIPPKLAGLLKRPAQSRSEAEEKEIAAFHRTIANTLAPARKQIAALEKKLAALKPSTTVPVMRDLPEGKGRVTKVQLRGNYRSTAETVGSGVPAVFHPLDPKLPKNRLALARWLVDSENPLTPRVIVNRFWGHLFGIGLVETSEEFGSQGEMPSHPELLDWLAADFVESGWNVKQLLKTIVMSSTYQQDSTVTPEALEADPVNRYYARGPRFRIPAETIRDQALFVSGLLSRKMYGPPVKPPQPSLGLKAAFGSSTDWQTSSGEDKFRRALYTTWRRSNPYPSMSTFDAPNREVCVSRRGRTNTPLQALVTLNDPVYVEAAQALARRVIKEGGKTAEERIRFAWRTVLVRDPSPAETERTKALIAEARQRFASQPDQAKMMATDPIGPAPKEADLVQLAAWTVAGNVLLNLDEFFLNR